MSSQIVLNSIKEEIEKGLPKNMQISSIEFEGPEIAIYTTDTRLLIDDKNVVKNLAKTLRKRIITRSDPTVRLADDKATDQIKKIVPPEAQITDINFDPNLGEVIVEAKKPGLVIGRNGVTLRRITKDTLWRPRVTRTPPIQSRIITQIRKIIQNEATERKHHLRVIGKRIHRPVVSKEEWITLTALGGFREVGRQCLLLQTPESNIMVDCGVNVGSSQRAFPHLDNPSFDIDKLDSVIITHAHLDHSGFLPWLFKFGYRGPVYCTEATRNLMTLLTLDYLDVAEREGKLRPYNQKDVKNMVMHTITLDYGEVTDIAPDVRLTIHNAGHILGSGIAHLHIGDGLYNLAYTGDLKYSKTRLLEASVNKFPRLETLIMESTYGAPNDNQPSYQQAEQKLSQIVNSTIERGGKVLIPVLAVGRAQEIMLVLEAGMRKKRIHNVPVYLDGMISEATAIHTTHPELLNRSLRDKIFHMGHNPFLAEYFVQVDSKQARIDITQGEPAIIMATSGMMSGGPSVEYFKMLASDPKNQLIFVTYQAEGTLGRRVQRGWPEIPFKDDNGKQITVKVKLNIDTIEGFSGHSDRRQLVSYARQISPRPERIIFCHGDPTKCVSMASLIHKLQRCETRAPQNLETIRLK